MIFLFIQLILKYYGTLKVNIYQSQDKYRAKIHTKIDTEPRYTPKIKILH